MAKAIVNGTLFDTEKATPLGEIGSGAGIYHGDFNRWEAILYRGRNGTFFMEGEGGPRSPFRRPLGDKGWSGSEGILPLAPEEALAHAEEHLSMDVLLEHFADLLDEA